MYPAPARSVLLILLGSLAGVIVMVVLALVKGLTESEVTEILVAGFMAGWFLGLISALWGARKNV